MRSAQTANSREGGEQNMVIEIHLMSFSVERSHLEILWGIDSAKLRHSIALFNNYI